MAFSLILDEIKYQTSHLSLFSLFSHEKPFDLRVGPEEFLVKPAKGMINDAMVKSVVHDVLHGSDSGTVEDIISKVSNY